MLQLSTPLFLLNRNTALADVDAGRAILIKLIAEHRDGYGQRADKQEQNAVSSHFGQHSQDRRGSIVFVWHQSIRSINPLERDPNVPLPH